MMYNDYTTRMAGKTAVRHEKSGVLTPSDGYLAAATRTVG